MKVFLKIFVLFLVWRIFLFLPLWFGFNHIPQQHDSQMYTLFAYVTPQTPVNSYFWYPWANFDGVHYLTIAYDRIYTNASDGRFFPFYPFLIENLTPHTRQDVPFGASEFFVAFFIANISFLLALFLLFKLIRLDFSEKIAWISLVLLLCFPTSFFFGSIYTESLFLFLTLAIFYCLRIKYVLLAATLSILLITTRIVGVCIIPILAYELFKQDVISTKNKKFHFYPMFLGKILLVAITPVGLAAFALYNLHFWGDALFFLHAQQHVVSGRSQALIFFPQTLIRYGKILLSLPFGVYAWWTAVVELVSFLFGAILLWYAYIKKIPHTYILFALFTFLIPTQSGTFSGLPRYVLLIFPAFIALAMTNKWVKVVYIVVGLVGLFLLTAYFSRGYFVA